MEAGLDKTRMKSFNMSFNEVFECCVKETHCNCFDYSHLGPPPTHLLTMGTGALKPRLRLWAPSCAMLQLFGSVCSSVSWGHEWISWVGFGSDLLPCLCPMITGWLMRLIAVTAPSQGLWDRAPRVRSLPVLLLSLACPRWWNSPSLVSWHASTD